MSKKEPVPSGQGKNEFFLQKFPSMKYSIMVRSFFQVKFERRLS